MMRKFLAILLFSFVYWSNAAFSQEPYYQHFSFYEGHSFRSVYSILEDRSGYIWFTSDEGLYRYNGANFKNFKNPQQTSFSGTYIKEDRLGRIWYQTFDGLFYYLEKNKLKHFQTKKTALLFSFQVSDKYIFILEENYIALYDIFTLKFVKRFKKEIEFIYCSTTFKGEFYYILGNYLYRINRKLQDVRVCRLPRLMLSSPLLCASDEAIYFTQKTSSDNVIYELKQEKVTEICKVDESIYIQNLQFLKRRLYLTTSDGLLIVNPKSRKKEVAYFKKRNFSAVLYDRKDNLWISSPNEGIFLLPSERLTRVNTSEHLPVRLALTDDSRLIFTTKNSEINWLNTSSYRITAERKSMVNAEGYYLGYFPKDQLLVSGFSDGFTYFDDLHEPKERNYKVKISLKKVVPIDHKYYAVIGTGYAGFFHLPGREKLTSSFDKYISKLSQGNYDGIPFFRLDLKPFYRRGKVLVYDSLNRTLYLGTSNSLFTWKNGEVEELFVNKSPVVLKSLFSFNGKVFGLKGAKSIVKISPFSERETQKFEELFKHTDVSSVRVFGQTIILQTHHYLRLFKVNAGNKLVEYKKMDISNIEVFDYVLDKQHVWISTIEGLLKWNIRQAHVSNNVGMFKLSQFSVNDQLYPINGQFFRYDQNNISIHFSVLDFGTKTIDRLYYRLNNNKWEKLDLNAQTLNFSSLSPDKYVVQFKGIAFGKPIYFDSVRFVIEPPFWSTWWFRILSGAVVCILLFGLYRYQIRKIIAKNKLINEKITLENNLNKSMITALKSQMNPHFFYNALNSIQGYVLTGEQQKASESIGLFSDLSRAVLESSRANEISLHDELELLETYLKLECMRMPKISYEMIVGADLRLYDIFLPPMILQPFAENAVKHGLANKDGDGKVTLRFALAYDDLLVEIEDDGVGREAASKIASMTTRKGSSFSTEANKSRIELLNINFEAKITYSIQDLYDAHQNPCGTKVMLVIPHQREVVA